MTTWITIKVYLVLALDDIQLLHGLIIAGLETENLGAVVPSLAPARLQLSHQVIGLKQTCFSLFTISIMLHFTLAFHSPITLSKFLPLFSVMMAAAWVRSYSI